MRGFPIRTPSDQRSVGSSPRLIAASHVLHRLLVPRHPPCALNNLTTQKPRTTPVRTQPGGQRCAATTYKPTLHAQEFMRTEFSTRCSRPLCSSQPTTRHRPPDPAEPRPTGERYEDEPALQRPTSHTPRDNPPPGRRPVPSGPNSAPTTRPSPTTPFPTPHHTLHKKSRPRKDLDVLPY